MFYLSETPLSTAQVILDLRDQARFEAEGSQEAVAAFRRTSVSQNERRVTRGFLGRFWGVGCFFRACFGVSVVSSAFRDGLGVLRVCRVCWESFFLNLVPGSFLFGSPFLVVSMENSRETRTPFLRVQPEKDMPFSRWVCLCLELGPLFVALSRTKT